MAAKEMKTAWIISLVLFSAVASVQGAGSGNAAGAGGQGKNKLTEHLKARRLKTCSAKLSVSLKEDTPAPALYVGAQDGLKPADKIAALPGQPAGIAFNQYSGYVTVEPKAGRALFYYFVEAPNSPTTKPLVLWLNGGPGCSSLGSGALTELGPFRVKKDGKTLWLNPYAWNNAANIIFLDSPAGVGFSYSNTTADYDSSGDQRTAADTYTFLVNWLERFPEYKDKDFYLTGESYAGHYVPELAQLILKNNKINTAHVINLKGIAIGNPLLDHELHYTGNNEYLWTHGLISDETHEAVVKNCNFSSATVPVSDACDGIEREVESTIGDLDNYNIYSPLCAQLWASKTPIPESQFDPCSDDYVANYLNIPEVQTALHTIKLPEPWAECSSRIKDNWVDAPDTILPILQELTASGIRVWIFSGDVDGVVSVTTTKLCLTKMGVKVKSPWRSWYTDAEVAGYTVEYENNLTFLTVKGAGHFVPSTQPARGLNMFSTFLEGKPLQAEPPKRGA